MRYGSPWDHILSGADTPSQPSLCWDCMLYPADGWTDPDFGERCAACYKEAEESRAEWPTASEYPMDSHARYFALHGDW